MKTSLPLPITFLEPRIVRCGKRHAKLSENQFTLLQYLCKYGKATYDKLRKHVFDKSAPDSVITRIADCLDNRLYESGIYSIAHKIISLDSLPKNAVLFG